MHPKESQPISATALRSLPLVSGLRVHLGLQPFLGDSLGGAWPEAGAKGSAGYRSFVGLLQVHIGGQALSSRRRAAPPWGLVPPPYLVQCPSQDSTAKYNIELLGKFEALSSCRHKQLSKELPRNHVLQKALLYNWGSSNPQKDHFLHRNSPQP